MSEIADSLREAADDLFRRELKGPGGKFSETLWRSLESVELPLVGVPEQSGGAGGGLGEATALARSTGYHAVPAPLVETGMLAGRVLAEAGFQVPSGPLSLVVGELGLKPEGEGWELDGTAGLVPWASVASHLVVLSRGQVALVDPGQAVVSGGANLAGEPRDGVAFRGARLPASAVRAAPPGLDHEEVLLRGALARAAQISGGLERILAMSVQYSLDRSQFGRPLARFQALQHGAATAAGDLAAAMAAVEAAVEAPGPLTIGIAKAVCSAAVGPATRFAHQLHGALGFTDEHPLYNYTTRLWAWRDEFGSEEEWWIRIGRRAAENGKQIWQLLS